MPVSNEISFADRRKYADVDKALSNFYEDIIEQVAGETNVSQKQIRRWFGETLITSSGIRAQVNRGKADAGGLPNKAADLFLAEHLIRNEGTRGGQWYELAHDRLIEPVLNSNTEWFEKNLNAFERQVELWKKENRSEKLLFSEQQMEQFEDWVNEHKDNLTGSEKDFWNACLDAREETERKRRELTVAAERERKEKKRYQIYSLVFTSLFVLACASLAFAFYVNSELKEQKKIVDDQSKELAKNYGILDSQKSKLDESYKTLTSQKSKLAKSNETLESQKNDLEKKKDELIIERNRATAQTKIANELSYKAEQATADAVRAKNNAVIAEKKAKTERENARKLEDLGRFYKNTLGYVSANDFEKAFGEEGFEKIIKQYENLNDKDGQLSTYITLGDTYSDASIEKSSEPNEEYKAGAIKSYENAVDIAKVSISDPKTTINKIEEKKANLYRNVGHAYSEAYISGNEKASENYVAAAKIYKQLNNKIEAAKVYLQAADLVEDGKQKNSLVDEAADLFKANNFENIKINLETANILERIGNHYKKQEKGAEYFIKVGEIYKKLEQKDLAVKAFLKAGESLLSNVSDTKTETYFKEALEIYRDDNSKTAEILVTIGMIYKDSAKDEARTLKYFSEAEEVFSTLEKNEAFLGFLNIAEQQSEPAKKIPYYEKAVTYLESSGLKEEKALMLIEIGDTYRQQGDDKNAKNYYDQAIGLYQVSGNRLGKVWALIEIGKAYFQSADAEKQKKADDYFKKTLEDFQQKSDAVNRALISLEICKIKNNGNLGTARLCFENVVNMLDNDSDRTLIRFKIGEIYESDKSDPTNDVIALEKFEEAYRNYEKMNDRLGQSLSLVKIGMIKYKSNKQLDKDAAKEIFDKFDKAEKLQIQNGDKLGEARTLIEIWSSLVSIDRLNSLEDGDKKFAYLKRAIDIYKQYPDRDIDLQARAFAGLIHHFPEDNRKAEYWKEALKFYEAKLPEISYVYDSSSPTGTICFSVFFREIPLNERSDLYKKIAMDIESQSVVSLKSVEERRNQVMTYDSLGYAYLRSGNSVNSRFNYWKAWRLFKQTVDDTETERYKKVVFPNTIRNTLYANQD